mgnify:CR=1 FL=1|jgi:hypothetical protein
MRSLRRSPRQQTTSLPSVSLIRVHDDSLSKYRNHELPYHLTGLLSMSYEREILQEHQMNLLLLRQELLQSQVKMLLFQIFRQIRVQADLIQEILILSRDQDLLRMYRLQDRVLQSIPRARELSRISRLSNQQGILLSDRQVERSLQHRRCQIHHQLIHLLQEM